MPRTFMTLSVCKTQYHKSVLTVALYTCLWYKLDPDLSEVQSGHSNQCVKLKYLHVCTALINCMDGSRFSSQAFCLTVV